MSTPRPVSFADIRALATRKASAKKARAALVVASETIALPAFLRAAEENLIEPTVISDEAKLRQTADEQGLSLDRVQILDIDQPTMAIQTAAKMAQAGDIDLIVQGRTTPEEMVLALTNHESDFVVPGSTLSHIGLMKPVQYSRLLMLTDGLVHDEPDLKTKLALLTNLSRFAEAIGIDNPRTAVVTAVEAIYPQMPATLDGAILAKMSSRGQIRGAIVDGPLSFDVAIDPEAAEAKRICDSDVAGRADAMLASTRQVAAGICQAMSLFAECDCGNVLIGGRVPVAVGFVTDTMESRYHSILLATLLASN